MIYGISLWCLYLYIDTVIAVLLLVLVFEYIRIRKIKSEFSLRSLRQKEKMLDLELKEIKQKLAYYKKHRIMPDK